MWSSHAGLRVAIAGFSDETVLLGLLERQLRHLAQDVYVVPEVHQVPCVFGLANLIVCETKPFCALPPETICAWVRSTPIPWVLLGDGDLDDAFRWFLAGLGVLVMRPQVPEIRRPMPEPAAAEGSCRADST